MKKIISSRNRSILVKVALTVGLIHLIIFILSVSSLALLTGGMKNRFRDIAVERHISFLVWNNIIVLKGYMVIITGYIILLFPAVKLWLGKKNVTFRAVCWRTSFLTLSITFFLALRVIHFRPYFLGKVNLDHYYYKFLMAIPEFMREKTVYGAFTVLPLIVLLSVITYYIYSFHAFTRSKRVANRYLMAGYGFVIVLCVFIFSRSFFPAQATVKNIGNTNVLVLLSDSLRSDHLSVNGYFRNTTPNIDRIAKESVIFTKCMTPIGSTLESIASMMSSQYPHTHGFRHMFPGKKAVEQFNTKTDTIAEELGKSGYNTIAMGDWCGSVFNVIKCGFEKRVVSDFDNFKVYMSEAVFMQHFILPLYFDNEFGYKLFPVLEAFASYLTPRVVTNRVISEIDRQSGSGKPYFMTVFYSCTHLPYSSSYPYYKMYSDKNYKGKNRTHLNFPVDDFINGNFHGNFGAGEEKQLVALYDGAVSEFDNCVGRIIKHLEETGQINNTIIVIASDHGDDLFEPNTTIGHGLTFNGGDQSTNIPLVFYHPDMKNKSKRISRICRSIDIAPTILDILGKKVPDSYEGTSLKPYITGTSKDLSLAYYGETSYLFFKRTVPGEDTLYIPPMDRTTYIDEGFDFHIVLDDKYLGDVIKTKERVVRTERYKLVYTPGKYHSIYRLYDIKKDPHCTRDISNDNRLVYGRMKKALRRWMDQRIETSTADIGVDKSI